MKAQKLASPVPGRAAYALGTWRSRDVPLAGLWDPAGKEEEKPGPGGEAKVSPADRCPCTCVNHQHVRLAYPSHGRTKGHVATHPLSPDPPLRLPSYNR